MHSMQIPCADLISGFVKELLKDLQLVAGVISL